MYFSLQTLFWYAFYRRYTQPPTISCNQF